MQYILNSIIKNGLLLFFLLLETISLVLTFEQNAFHKSYFGIKSLAISGYIYDRTSSVTGFLQLAKDNRTLQNENIELRKALLMKKTDSVQNIVFDSSFNKAQYSFIPVEIINNSIVKEHNFITINKGDKFDIEKGDGIISSNGLIGIVIRTSPNYAKATSLLNTDIKINARIKRNQFYGTLMWDGKDQRYVQLREIPKYISVEKGDTIETDGKSPVFPEGILIGTVESKVVDEISGELNIQIRLKEDFSRIRYGYVVKNSHKLEIEKLDSTNNAQ